MYCWNQEGIPHKGWRHVDVIDLGPGNFEACQMCGNEQVRYIHIMEHCENERLSVGCVCAEKMSLNYVTPKQRERSMRNLAKRKQNWLKRKWRLSGRGNPYIKYKGHVVVIFKNRGGRFGLSVDREFATRSWETIEEAKRESFEHFEEMVNQQ